MVELRSCVEKELSKLLIDSGRGIVHLLSLKYGFSEEDGLTALNLEGYTVKHKSERERVERVKSKVPLPFCGFEKEMNCAGIRLNHSLYTQCTNDKGDNGLCTTCLRQAEKNSNGEPTYGLISNRIAKGKSFTDPKGKAPVRYGNVMEKLNITREEAETEARKFGLVIPEEEFEVKRARRGRPRKDTSANDTSEEEIPKKQRGRPKKNKKVVSTSAEKEDDAESQTSLKSEATDSDEEETAVKIVAIDGKKYLKADDNTMYNFETHEELGTWNPETRTIE